MNENFIQYVHERLEQWAEWYSNDNSYGLGYSNRSIEYVLMQEGAYIKSTAPKQLPSNIEAEEIEALVIEIDKQNKKMALALRIQYFGRRKSKDRSETLGISATQFRVYVDMARQWLAGRLSSSNKYL